MTALGPPRLLFITSNRLGDAVLSTGALAALLERAPQTRVTVACGGVPAGLFADLPGLDHVHVMVKRKRAGHWCDLWKAAIGVKWDVVADLRGSAFAWTVRARQRLLCRNEPDRHHRREHRIEEIARQLGLTKPPAPRLWISTDRALRAVAVLGDGPVLAVGPTANWGGKQWPADRFADAALRLTASDGILPGARIAIFGAANEREQARVLLEAIPDGQRLDFIGNLDLADTGAVLSRCSFYLGNDSGLMHMAAASGIPTLGLFGPSPDWRYGPWGAHCTVVRTPQSFEELVSENPHFDYRRSESLMTGLSVAAVTQAAAALWMRLHP